MLVFSVFSDETTSHSTKETLIKSSFVIPAKAGIQCFQWTGHRPSPV